MGRPLPARRVGPPRWEVPLAFLGRKSCSVPCVAFPFPFSGHSSARTKLPFPAEPGQGPGRRPWLGEAAGGLRERGTGGTARPDCVRRAFDTAVRGGPAVPCPPSCGGSSDTRLAQPPRVSGRLGGRPPRSRPGRTRARAVPPRPPEGARTPPRRAPSLAPQGHMALATGPKDPGRTEACLPLPPAPCPGSRPRISPGTPHHSCSLSYLALTLPGARRGDSRPNSGALGPAWRRGVGGGERTRTVRGPASGPQPPASFPRGLPVWPPGPGRQRRRLRSQRTQG